MSGDPRYHNVLTHSFPSRLSADLMHGLVARVQALFDRLVAYYERGLLWVLARQRATLLVALATFVLTALLYLLIAKGLFPTQDTGQLQARTQAADSEIGRAHV